MQQMQSQAQQMQMQQQQADLKMQQMALQQQAQKPAIEMNLKQAELQQKSQLGLASAAVDEFDAETRRMVALSKIEMDSGKLAVEDAKIQAENVRTMIDVGQKKAEHKHSVAMDILGLHDQREESKNKNTQVTND